MLNSAWLYWRPHERGADSPGVASALAIEFDLGKHWAHEAVKAALAKFRALNLA